MNSGKVQLDVVLRGKDEVSAVLAQVEKQAKETERQLNAIGEANANPDVGGISAMKDSLGGTVEAVDKAEEKFNKLVGAIGFVSAAFAVASEVYTFVQGILGAKSAVEQTIRSLQSLKEVGKELRDTLDQIALRRAPNEAAREAVELEQEKRDLIEQQVTLVLTNIGAMANIAGLQQERKRVAKEIAELEKLSADNALSFETTQVELAVNKKNLLLIDRLIKDTNDKLLLTKGGEAKLVREIEQLERDRNEALKTSAIIIEQNKRKYQELIYMMTFGARGIKPAEPEEEKKPLAIPTPAPAEERRSIIDVGLDAFRGLLKNAVAKKKQAEEQFKKNLEDMAAKERVVAEQIAGSARAALAEEIEQFRDLALTVDTAAKSFDDFTTAVLSAADAFPELGDAMNGINAAFKAHAEQVAKDRDLVAKGELTAAQATVNAEQSKTKAIISGSTEGLAAIGKLVGGLKAEYALRAAGELAMGFATLANPVESAGHFVAAGLFAVAAGKAASSGGAGASAAGADSEAPATSSSLGYGDGGGGQRTVVYNFSTLLADRQQVHRAIRDSELVGQRNGYGRRRGV